jgi:Mg-chelatase subunit ChlD
VRLAAVGALLRLPHADRAPLLYASAVADPSEKVRAAAAAVLDLLEADAEVVPQAIADLGAEARETRVNARALLHALAAPRFEYDPDAPAAGQEAWAAWWARREDRGRPSDGFRYHVEDLRRRGLDVVLVMDATGSMAPVLEATKSRLEALVRDLRRVVPDLRARVVAYRDAGDAFLTLASPLTHDVRVLEDFLACVPASGGGDAPEAVLAGVKAAVEATPWRPGTQRVVVVFGDAPPHEKDEPLLEAVCKDFKGSIHAVDVGGYGEGGRAAPIEPFRRMATWGRGAAVTLAGEHDLLRHLLVLVLGPRHRTAVETLFGL